MKKILILIIVLLSGCIAYGQEKPVYEQTHTPQVLSNWANWSRYFLAIPHGNTLSVPAYVPDSLKVSNLFYKIASGDTALYVGGKKVSGDTVSLSNRIDQKISLSEKGIANGVSTLDGSGKVPLTQLPANLQVYMGQWDPITNTPTLVNGVGKTGDVWEASADGIHDWGTRIDTVRQGDFEIYNGTTWELSGGVNRVTIVNGYQGIVMLNTDDIGEGTTNKYYTDIRVAAYGDAHYYPLGNPAGYLTSFTETDPTVPSYAKSLTAFSVIQTSTDALYASKTNFSGTSSGTNTGDETAARINALYGYTPANGANYLPLHSTADNSTKWLGLQYSNATPTTSPLYVMASTDGGTYGYTPISNLQSVLGLGSNAYISTPFLPLTAGSGSPLTGDLYIKSNLRLSDETGYGDIIGRAGSGIKFYTNDGASQPLTITSTGVSVSGTGTFSGLVSSTAEGITTTGVNNGFNFADRTTSSSLWSLYADAGLARLYNSNGNTVATFSTAGDATVSGDVTAASFTGAGTGLTGTAAALTVGNSTKWFNQSYTFSAIPTPGYFIGASTGGGDWGSVPISDVKTALGISGGPFLPLIGGTISRDAADATAALIVDQHNLSSTGNIQGWQFNGIEVAHLEKDGTFVSNANIHGSGNLEVSGLVQGSQFKLTSLNPAPSSSSDTGTAGEIRFTAGYIYVCTNTNTWGRAALSFTF